jgi:outer membrane protein
MYTMKNHLLVFLLIFSVSWSVTAQEEVLNGYVQTALQSNIALEQKNLSFEKSLKALEEAKGMFWPKLSLEARYSLARGGRAFEIPVGDLVNPIYDNLNLVNSFGQSASPDYPTIPEYPQISNVQENFLRESEQETFLRMAMPVFNAAILQNHRIQENLSEAEKIGVEIYKRELVKEVKSAYFNYMKAYRALELYQNTLELVQENQRTSESLYNNNKVTIDEVFAAKAQVEEIRQQLAMAEKDEKTAKAFFNFLLNRPYDSNIDRLADQTLPGAVIGVEDARNQAFQNREELQQLNYYLAVSDNQVDLNKGNYLPNVNLVVDYGVQGVDYNLDQDSDYVMGSVVMSWSLFDRTTKAKVDQAKVAKLEVQQQKAEARQQIGLQVVNAYYDLEAGLKRITAGQAEVEAAQKAFRLVNKKYQQGQANLVTFKNARTQLTNAEQSLLIARYDYQIKIAELERATGTYSFQ